MRIPRKITPDGLTDAVVVVRYPDTDTPYEALFGEFYKVLKQKGFSYLPPVPDEPLNSPATAHVFFNEQGLVIGSRPGQLWFNGVTGPNEAPEEAGSYIGWGAYQQLLAAVLQPLLDQPVLRAFSAVTVRYINILPWRALSEQIISAPAVPTIEGISQAPSFEYRLNWPISDDGYRVRVRLTDQVKRRNQPDGKGTLFDVEVTRSIGGTAFAALRHALELTHQKQKEVFFGLLSPDFLASLHPEYDPE